MRTMSTSNMFFLSSTTRIEGYTNQGCERKKKSIFFWARTLTSKGTQKKLSQPPDKSPQ